MTKAELRTDLYRRLEESSSSPVFFSEDDLDEALDEAYMEISDETEWREVYRTVDLLHTRPYYDLRTVFPEYEVLTPGKAFHEDTNRWLIPSSARDLDAGYRRWEQVNAQPERVVVRGLWWLLYWPITQAESGTVKQYATVLPDALDDDDEPGFEAVFHPALVEYALARLLPQLGEVTKALDAWAQYLAYEAGLTAFVQGRGLVPMEQGFGPVAR